jgi:PhzF family phenazine biosynthesis protein
MVVDTRPQTLPFSVENAFTDRIEGGNPAAIVRVPTLTALPDTTLQTIATNFNQPMTVFIAPLSPETDSDTLTFGIRWFTPEMEIWLCGHGTLVAAATVFRSSAAAPKGPIRFEAPTGKVLVARQVEDGRIEIELDAERAEALVGAEDAQVREVLASALGKDVCVKYAGRGASHLHMYSLVEVDTHDLKGFKVDTEALVSRLCVCFLGCLIVFWGG